MKSDPPPLISSPSATLTHPCAAFEERAQQSEIRFAQPLGGGVHLVPVWIVQHRRAHLVELPALLIGELAFARRQVAGGV